MGLFFTFLVGALIPAPSSDQHGRRMRLFILGLGYSARHFVAKFGSAFTHIAGTVRDPAKRETIAGIEAHPFSGSSPDRDRKSVV